MTDNKSLLLLLSLGTIWGVNFLFMKWAVVALSPEQVVWLRMLSASVPLGVYCLIGKKIKKDHFSFCIHFILMALLANVINFYFFAKATTVIPSGLTGAMSGTIPLFSILLAFVFLKNEGINKWKILGVFVGFLGLLLLSRPWEQALFQTNINGIIYMIIGSLVYAMSFIYAKRYLSGIEIEPIVLATYQTFCSLLILSFFIEFSSIGQVFISPRVFFSTVVGLGFLGTGIAYIIYYKLINEVGAVGASTVTYIPPVIALIAGGLFSNEVVGLSEIFGMIIILIGVYLARK